MDRVQHDKHLVGAKRFARRGDQDMAIGAAPADLDGAGEGEFHGGQRGESEEAAASAPVGERERAESRQGRRAGGGWAPEFD